MIVVLRGVGVVMWFVVMFCSDMSLIRLNPSALS
jgi:hypothetical protein